MLIGFGFTIHFYRVFFVSNTAFSEAQKSIFISTPTNFNQLQIALEPMLKRPSHFASASVKKAYHLNVQPGHYILEKGMSNNEIINTLRVSNTPISVTFNNQQTFYHLAGRVAAQIEADSVSIVNAFFDEDFLKKHQISTEELLAYCLPNSYSMFWNSDGQDFRDRMLKEYRRFWNNQREQQRKKIGLTKEEVITLASIVYKETLKKEEQPIVAGVYLNRLKRGMRLQADPTVVFALKQKAQNYDLQIRRVLYKDLEINSPYNTYRYRGLPPGPICMPDLSAVDAVLNSKTHHFLYFVVNPQKPGYHWFSKNYQQHLKYQKKYIAWLNGQRIMR